MFRWLILTVVLALFFFEKSYSQKQVSLKRKKITSIEILLKPGSLVIPGNSFEIGATILTATGEMLKTEGWMGGKLKWKNLRVELQGGKFSSGKIVLEKGEEVYGDSLIKLKVYSRYDKTLVRTKVFPLNHLVDLKLYTGPGFTKAPGSRFPIEVTATYDNGVEIHSFDYDKCPDKFENLDVWVSGGFYNKNYVYISEIPRQIHRHRVSVAVASKHYPSVRDTVDVFLNYIKDYQLVLHGSNGSNGFGGSSGSNGSPESCGGVGSNGGEAWDGSDGPDIDIFMDVYFDSLLRQQLIALKVSEARGRKTWEYLINPKGGSLSLYTYGGDGGIGGPGGHGGEGGKGREGERKVEKIKVNDSTTVEKEIIGAGGPGGSGGNGGIGGDGGEGGDGGTIIVKYTSSAYPYLDRLDLQSFGGRGGSGGAGGAGGRGGEGGNGNPNGSNGADGSCGVPGKYGSDGSSGRIRYVEASGISQH